MTDFDFDFDSGFDVDDVADVLTEPCCWGD